jgi:hypothetical protein
MIGGSCALQTVAPAGRGRPIYPSSVLVRVGLMLVALIVVLLVLGAVLSRRRDAPRPVTALAPRARPQPRRYDWERRSTQLYRAWKQVPGPAEDREGILAFASSRQGVEAYVEPRTVIHPLSVVLIAEDGEWKRFELRDDAYLRELVKERGLRVVDATRFGYPERMNRHREGEGDEA